MGARATIPGALDLAALQALADPGTDYRARAELHRPVDQDAIAGEARRLYLEGLSRRGVADALRVDLLQVIEWTRGLCLAPAHGTAPDAPAMASAPSSLPGGVVERRPPVHGDGLLLCGAPSGSEPFAGKAA